MYSDTLNSLINEIDKLSLSKYQTWKQKLKNRHITFQNFSESDYEYYYQYGKKPRKIQLSSFILSKNSLRALVNFHEINDEIVNSYLSLVKDKQKNFRILNTYFCYILSKPFSTLYRILVKNGVSKENTVLIPLYLNKNHWILVAASADAIKIYDSMKNKGIPKEIHLFFENYYDKKLEITVSEGYPQQNNVYDCGIFMLSAIEDLIEGREWTFSQEKMPEIRLEIAKKLMNYGL